MVAVVQLVRTLGCGSRGRGFKSHQPPQIRGFSERHLRSGRWRFGGGEDKGVESIVRRYEGEEF